MSDAASPSRPTTRPERGAEVGRVAEMHRHTRWGLAVSGAFAIAAVVAALVPHDTGAWLPLHLFFVGSLTTAIATVTLMLAVTWSTSPTPPRRIVTLQRWALAAGVVLVVAGRESLHEGWTVVGGSLVAASLAVVAVLLIDVRRTAHTPRFAPAIEAYVLAIAGALVGIVLGVGLSSRAMPDGSRNAHILVNLFGFVGVVIAGTLPYFTATQARMKMAPRTSPARLRAASAVLWTAAIVAAVAAYRRHDDVAAVAIACYGLGLVVLTALLPLPRRKQLDWAGPRLLQLFAGIAWWAVMTFWIAATYDAAGIERGVLLALVIGGYAQILVASFAYLVPVIRGGGHEQLGAGFRRTRSWAGLALGNLTALLALIDQEEAMTVALCAWAIDAAVRTAVRRRIEAETKA